MLTKIAERARRLVDQYGPEVSMCARVAVTSLLPAGSVLAEGVSAVCEYVSDKSIELDNAQILSRLGELKDDQEHVAHVFQLLLNKMGPLLSQLLETQRTDGLEIDQVRELMRRQCLTSLSTQREIEEVQRELLKLQPTLSFIRRRSSEILRVQEESSAEIKREIKQLGTLLDTMLSYSAPLSAQELTQAQRREFYQLHSAFQAGFLAQDLSAMKIALFKLVDLAPYHPMTNICEAAYAGLQRDFSTAREVIDGLPDELTSTTPMRAVQEAFGRLSPDGDDEDIAFEGDEGEVCLGKQGWSQVTKSDELTWSLENLARGWLLRSKPGAPRATQWRVMSLEGEPGAMHVIQGQLTRRGDYYRRFKDEVRSLKSVEHPSVLRVLDWGRTPARDPYLITEPLKNETLEGRLAQGRLSPNEMKQLGSALFASLEACHDQGLLHRNIHPCTIQFREDNTPVFIGFGVACQELEVDGEGRRSDPFASPEQRRGEPAEASTDIYSLGAVLIESVGGINAVPQAWRNLLSSFVNPVASSRPSASEANDRLPDLTLKYYATLPGQPSRGPYEVKQLVEMILRGDEELTIQRVGSLDRKPWAEVEEVAIRVERAKRGEPLDGPRGAEPSDAEPQLTFERLSPIHIGRHQIRIYEEEGQRRSDNIRSLDAAELAKRYESSQEDHTFLSELRKEDNGSGELAVSKVSADRFLRLLRAHLEKIGDPRSDQLSLMRAGGKGPFYLQIR